jgi:replicative DNA helicase
MDAYATTATDAERKLIGGIMLLGNDVWPEQFESLTPGHFLNLHLAQIYRAAVELRESGQPIDALTLRAQLPDAQSPKNGWSELLVDLSLEIPTTAVLGPYASIVIRESTRRDVLRVFSAGIKQASDVGEDPTNAVQDALYELARLEACRKRAAIISLLDSCRAEMRRIDDQRDSGTASGIPTGYSDLDKYTCGLVPGHLVVVAGRPSMGKSSLARNIAARMAMRGKTTLIFSLEMTSEEITQAMLACESRVTLHAIRHAKLGPGDNNAMVEAMQRIAGNIFVADKIRTSVADIRLQTRTFATRHQLDAVVVDYIQLASGRGNNREQEIASISRGLKALAMELKIPVVALSQLNRSLESRTNKRPMLSDLRESGAIEQDADEVLMLYRGDYYADRQAERGVCEVGIAKNRSGPTGVVKLRWHGATLRFDPYIAGGPSYG